METNFLLGFGGSDYHRCPYPLDGSPVAAPGKAVPPGAYDFEKIQALVDGNTLTAGKHIREGVVIRAYPDRPHRTEHYLGRAQLKIISNQYLEREGKS